MQVVILAAGRGSRLGSLTDGLPKCLLQVGGESLIEHMLRTLAELGASPVLIVIGFAADLVRETIGSRAEFLFNPRYERTNSMYSLYLARNWIRGPVLILNSDLLVDPEAFERLLRAGPDHLLFDSSSGKGMEHMKIRVENGRVRDISKDLPREDSHGENVGAVYLSEASVRIVLDRCAEILSEGKENLFWAEALRRSLPEIALRPIDIAGIPWVEIDTPYDLDRARKEVWPEMQKRTGSRLVRSRRRRIRTALAVVAGFGILAGTAALGYRSQPEVWEDLPIQAPGKVTITVNGTPQEWHEIRGEQIARTWVQGPATLRVDVRGLFPPGVSADIPYVFEILLNDRRHDLFKFTSRPSPNALYPGTVVGDRDKTTLELPEGSHSVGVRLLAGDLAGLLTRFKILEPAE